ncbi:hypothetical protein [Streptomyces sp. NRRL S-378]|uniref:hypothetical protein n=1 Tax=Streptomyces sp. NRRL S-378 TaxID=1463904 RepID=UPI001F245D59|nr:hypothetical protein [Streptomyces sp. NRRL S-378]
MLIEHLPPESATKTEIRNSVDPSELTASGDYRPDLGQWSAVEMLLAALRDEIVLSRHVAIAAAGGTAPEFEPMSRPGIPPKSAVRRTLTDEQRRAIDPRLRDQPMEA